MFRITSRLLSVALCMIILIMPLVLVSFLSDTLDVTTKTILPPLWASTLRGLTTEIALHRFQSAVATTHRADSLVSRRVGLRGYLRNEFLWNATRLCTATDGEPERPTRPPPSGSIEWGRTAAGDDAAKLRDILLQARTLGTESMVPAILFPPLKYTPIPPTTTAPPNLSSSSTTQTSTTTTTTTTTSTTTTTETSTTITTTTAAPGQYVPVSCAFPNFGFQTMAVDTSIMRNNWRSRLNSKVTLSGNNSMKFQFLHCPLDVEQMHGIDEDLTQIHSFWPHFMPMVQWYPSSTSTSSGAHHHHFTQKTKGGCARSVGEREVALLVSRVVDKKVFEPNPDVPGESDSDDGRHGEDEHTRTPTMTQPVPPKYNIDRTLSRTISEKPSHWYVETNTMGAVAVAFDRQLAMEALSLVPKIPNDPKHNTDDYVPQHLRDYSRRERVSPQVKSHLMRVINAVGATTVGAMMWDTLYDIGMVGVGEHQGGLPTIELHERLHHPRRDTSMRCDLFSLTSTTESSRGTSASKTSFTIDATRGEVRDFCPIQLERDILRQPDGSYLSQSITDIEYFRDQLSLSLDTDNELLNTFRTPRFDHLEAATEFFAKRFVGGLFEIERNTTAEMFYQLGLRNLNLTRKEAEERQMSQEQVASAAAQTPEWQLLRLDRQRRMQQLITGTAIDHESLETALNGNESSLVYVVPQEPQVKGIIGGLIAVTDIYVLDIIPRSVFDAQQDNWIRTMENGRHPSSNVQSHTAFAFEDLGERVVRRSYPYKTTHYACSMDATLPESVQSPVDHELETLQDSGIVGGAESNLARSRCIVPSSFAVMRRISIVVLAEDPDNILGVDIFSGPVAATVIANIVTTCIACVCIFSALDALFRPLKYLAQTLRNIADDQIREIEPSPLSRIAEIRAVQLATEGLVKAVILYSRFLPSRSLLMDSSEIDPAEASTRFVSSQTSFLGAVVKQAKKLRAYMQRIPYDEKDEEPEEEEMIRRSQAALRAKIEASRIQGTSHTVWIKATYRSRRDPNRARTTYEPKKHCSFRHTFACGDDVYGSVLEEIRKRLSERVGEPLQLRDVGYNALPVTMGDAGQVTSLDADLYGSRRLIDANDFLEAFERSHGRPLYLVLLKTSKKNFFPWIHAICCIFATIFMYQISQDWEQTPISDIPKNAAKAIVAFLSIRFAYNLIVAFMLLVWFTVVQHNFFTWMCMAIPEVIIALFLSAFTLDGVFVLFSAISLGKVRFNAPFHPAMTVASRYALPGHVLGDALGMIPLGYAAAFEGSSVVSGVVVVAILFSLISLLGAFFYTPMMQRIASWFPSYQLATCIGDTQDFREWDAPAADSTSQATGAGGNSRSTSKQANDTADELQQQQQQQNQQQQQQHRSVSATSTGGTTTKTAATQSVTMPPAVVAPSKQPPMNLCEREASVVKLCLRDTPMHIERLSGVQMAELVENFVSLAAREAEVYGGLVLRVMGTEVTVGFNCHHIQNFHVLSAAKFYFAMHRAISSKLASWCPDDDPEKPMLCGALVSGASLAIGYIGTAEARSVQHLGIGELLLTNLLSNCEHLGATFLTTRQTAGQLQLQADYSRKTYDADRLRRQRTRDRVVQSLTLNAATLRSTSVNSVSDSGETAGERLSRERKNKDMESFAAFFAEIDDPSADADVVLMHQLRVREVDGISITLPSYHRDRFRSALDNDGVPVSSSPYERDLSVFEVTTALSADDITVFNREVENLFRGPAGGGGGLLTSQTSVSGTTSGGGGGFAHYCSLHPHDAVAHRMKFINASRNPTGRNVRFVTPLGVGFRRVELRLAQVAAIARQDVDSDDDIDLNAVVSSGVGVGEKSVVDGGDMVTLDNSPAAALSGINKSSTPTKTGPAAAAAAKKRNAPSSGGGLSENVLQRIQNKDQYTVYFTDL